MLIQYSRSSEMKLKLKLKIGVEFSSRAIANKWRLRFLKHAVESPHKAAFKSPESTNYVVQTKIASFSLDFAVNTTYEAE